MENRVGEKFITNEGLEVVIIDYKSARNCTVQYRDGFILTNKYYLDIKRGKIKNPNNPNVYGIGYIGIGKYKSKVNNVRTKSYLVWADILRRCYDPKYKSSRPSYDKCTISKEWHNFQNFAKWFDENYIEGFCIDKDILIKGNKEYSPDKCCFVPNELNIILSSMCRLNRELPLGVVKHEDKYRAQISIKGKTTYLGIANTPELAFLFYKNFKENYLKESAIAWKSYIPIEVYQALYNYRIEITD